MENIIKYTEFLNEKQLEFPFMDEVKMEEQRDAQMKLFKKGFYTMEQLDHFFSLNPTRAEINDIKGKLIQILEDVNAVLKYHENKKLPLSAEDLNKIKTKLIPNLTKMIAAIKKR